MSSHLPGVPHLHVNRPLLKSIISFHFYYSFYSVTIFFPLNATPSISMAVQISVVIIWPICGQDVPLYISGGDISNISLYRPKGLGFALYWSENGGKLCSFWSGIGYGFY